MHCFPVVIYPLTNPPLVNDCDAQVPGNKMDIHNLAVVMGPNILRPHKVSGYSVLLCR